MAENPQIIDALAETLWQARTTGAPCPPLTETHPALTLTDAYSVSRNVLAKRTRAGAIKIGHKIGLTSAAVQKQLGVTQPDFGYLTSDMMIDNGGIVSRSALLQGKAEGEVAFVLSKDLKGPGVTVEDVMAATDHVIACIEIIDSRVKDWKIKIQDTVADNASSALVVLGSKPRKLSTIDLKMAGMTLRRNGEIESTGVGAACLGHPVNAVMWLANTLGALGETLKAGDLILSGAYGPVVPFACGDTIEVEISGLGKVTCSREKP